RPIRPKRDRADGVGSTGTRRCRGSGIHGVLARMKQRVVYSNLKVLNYADRVVQEDGPLAAPVHVRIKPTNACNQSCFFCAYRHEELHLGDGMEVRDRICREKMLEIADDLIEMGVEAVTFSGG